MFVTFARKMAPIPGGGFSSFPGLTASVGSPRSTTPRSSGFLLPLFPPPQDKAHCAACAPLLAISVLKGSFTLRTHHTCHGSRQTAPQSCQLHFIVVLAVLLDVPAWFPPESRAPVTYQRPVLLPRRHFVPDGGRGVILPVAPSTICLAAPHRCPVLPRWDQSSAGRALCGDGHWSR